MEKKSNWESVMQVIVIGMFSLGVLVLGSAEVYKLFHPQKEMVTFNVVGISNYSQNASTILSLHYECFKLCNNKYYDSYSYLTRCYDECSKMVSNQQSECECSCGGLK